MTPKFRIRNINEGFCRVNYVTKNAKGEYIFYCLQWEYFSPKNIVNLYRLSQNGEPSYQVKLKSKAKDMFEMPRGDSELIKACREWIERN